MSASQLRHLTSVNLQEINKLYSDLHSEKHQTETLSFMGKYHVITIVDEMYPSVLKRIKDPPIVLYAHGNIDLLRYTPSLSVIGTRKPSIEAKEKLKLIVEPMIRKKWLIVSGMAIGVDGLAHWKSLKNNGKTIAVLGGGFDHIYPKQNIPLYEKIVKSGLIISEYAPNIRPARYHFPERNRIISGLSFGTLVIEATERSGTLITVDQALDQGREVYAVPGSPLLKQTIGCHRMIQDGAKLVINANDILEDWEQMGHHLFYN